MRGWISIGLLAALAGCAEQPPPVAPGLKLAEPPGWAMKRPQPITPIPERDGDPAVRRDWYGQELKARAQCEGKLGALQAYVRKVRE